MKKTVVALLLTLVLLMTGCSAENGSSVSVNDASSVTSEADKIVFAAEGTVVVRPSENSTLTGYAADVFKSVKALHNVNIKNCDDTSEAAEVEILIGNCNRSESVEAFKLLDEKGTGRHGEYIICVLNGKVVINAVDESSLELAVGYFIDEYCAEGFVPADLCYVKINDEGFGDITLCGESIRRYRFVVPKYNMSYLVAKEVEKLRDYIYDTTGYKLEIVDDTVPKVDREIVIGDCNRADVERGFGNDGYQISQIGNSFYIVGGRNYSLAFAVQEAYKNISEKGNICEETITGKYDGKTELDNGYRLVWTDEFDSFDRDIWNVREGKGSETYGGWYGMTTYRSGDPKNLSVRDGKLYMTASYDDKYFYGAYMTTSKSLNFIYGYMEISARVADGYGIWHDFWTWSDNPDHLEFDIMECWSGANYYVNCLHEMTVDDRGVRTDNVPGTSYVTKDKHYVTNEHNKFYASYEDWRHESMNLEFHTFGCEWTEQEVIFTRDGEVTMVHNYKDTANERLYSQPHYFILSMLVGSNYSDAKPEDIADKKVGILAPILGADYWYDDRASFIVEYVQLFQKNGHYNDAEG